MPTLSLFSNRRVVLAIAIVCCLLWGSAVPGVKAGYALLGILPFDTPSLLLFAGVRFTAAGLLLLAFAALTARPLLPSPRRLGELALLGLGQTAVVYLFYYVGLANTTAVKASIMNATGTFFSVLLAHFLFLDDRLTWRKLMGCLVGFAGVVVVNVSGAGLDAGLSFLGEGFVVISTFLLALASIYGRRLSQNMDTTVMTGWQLAIGGVALAAAGLIGGGHLDHVGIEALALVAYLAALSAVAFTLWSVLLKHNPVGSIAAYNFLIPIFGVGLAGLWLGETILEWKNLVALILVSLGIRLVTVGRSARM